jgi:hypothetical protein
MASLKVYPDFYYIVKYKIYIYVNGLTYLPSSIRFLVFNFERQREPYITNILVYNGTEEFKNSFLVVNGTGR